MHFIQQVFLNIFHAIVPLAHAENASAPAAASNPAQVLGLDWKLFIAQLINFSIVLFVLWKWAFKPLGAKLQERTEKIEKSLKDAEEISRQKEEAEKFRIAEMEKTGRQAQEMLNKAEAAAAALKEEIVGEAKAQAQKLLEQVKKQGQSEKEKMLGEFKAEAAELVVSVTEKIILSRLDKKSDAEFIKKSIEEAKL